MAGHGARPRGLCLRSHSFVRHGRRCLRQYPNWPQSSFDVRHFHSSFTFIAPHSRARGADDGGRRRRDASYGVARDSNPVSTIRCLVHPRSPLLLPTRAREALMMAGAGGAMRATGWRATVIRFQQFGEGALYRTSLPNLRRRGRRGGGSLSLGEGDQTGAGDGTRADGDVGSAPPPAISFLAFCLATSSYRVIAAGSRPQPARCLLYIELSLPNLRRRLRRQPMERNLVARQKPAQAAGRSVPTVTDQCYAWSVRFRGNALKSPHPFARKCANLHGNVLRRCRDHVIFLEFDTHLPVTALRLDIPRKRTAKGNWHLSKNGAGNAPAKGAFDPVHHLNHFNLPRENSKERRLPPFMDRKFSSIQM